MRSSFKKRVLSLVPIAALGAALLPVSPAQATFPGDNGAIVWSSTEVPSGPNSPMRADIYIKEVGAATAVNLTPDTNSEEAYPAVSPDGTTLAFGSDRNSPGDLDPFLLDLNTLEVTALPSTVNTEGWFTWSRDGNKLAWSVLGTSGWTTKVFNLSTAALTHVGEGWHPQFSADGSQVVFIRPVGGINDIFAVELSDGSLFQLTNTPDDHEFAPNFSPDGTKILYSKSNMSFSEVNLWTMSKTGGSQAQLTALTGWESEPAWSPDGTQIVYTRDPDGAEGPASQDLVIAPFSDPNSSTSFYVSEDVEDHPDWQALPTDPGPDPEPEPTEVKPTIVLKLVKHLVAKATVGAGPCAEGLPVKVQKSVSGTWKTLASGATGDIGIFKARVPDKPGKYRAVSTSFTTADGTVCLASKSITVTHKH